MIDYRDIPFEFLQSEVISVFITPEFRNECIAYGEQFNTIGEALDNVKDAAFKKKLMNWMKVIPGYYELSVNFNNYLTNNASQNDSLRESIICFVSTFVNYGISCSRLRNMLGYLFEGFAKLYLYDSYDSTIYTFKDLQEVSGKSIETYRIQYIKKIYPFIRTVLSGKDTFMKVPDSIANRYNAILERFKGRNILMQSEVQDILDGLDPRSKAFLMVVYEFEEYISQGSLFEPMLIRKDWCKFTSLNKVEGRIVKILSENQSGVSLRYNLIPKIVKNNSSEHLRKALEEILLNSDRFNVRETIDGDVTVSLKWKYLSSQTAKLERLLFDQKFENPANSSLSLEQILERYNIEARKHGIEEITINQLHVKKTKFIAPQGKTGHWYYTDGQKVVSIKAADFVKSYVLEHEGRVTFSEVYAAAQAKGYHNTQKSIRTYLTNCCYSVIGISDMFVYKDYADQYAKTDGYSYDLSSSQIDNFFIPLIAKVLDEAPNKTLRECDLRRKIVSPEGELIANSTLSQLLRNDLKDFVRLHTHGKRTDVELIVEPSKFVRPKDASQKPEYFRLIYQAAVELLKEKKGEMKLRDLKAATIHMLPVDINPNNIYKVFKSPIFKKTDHGTVTYVSLNSDIYKAEYFDKEESYPNDQLQKPQSPVPSENMVSLNWQLFSQYLAVQFRSDLLGIRDISAALQQMVLIMGKGSFPVVGSEFWKIMLGLQQLYMGKTSPNDRELLMSKLALYLENYLKNLYEIKRSFPLTNTKGLHHVITILQDEKLLPNRSDMSTTLADNLNQNIGKILYIRNNIAHAGENKIPSMVDIINKIRLMLEFYVLVAAWSV